jgi:L-alanine-DL-glutamate epimerase-like enolase superfamily enzyme
MRIKSVELYQSKIKLREPFVISLGLLDHAANIIVVIRTDEGIAGFGECSPFMTINGESMDTCFIVGQYLAKRLIGRNPLDIELCSATMDATIYGNSSIKSAFEIAVYDIASQHAGKPLYAFLGGKKDKTLVTDYTVSLGNTEKMVSDAIKIKAEGFRIIKVKLGESGEKDVNRIRLIREAVGNEIQIRIDANQAWSPKQAINILNDLGQYDIQHCEEPIARWNYMELGSVRAQSPIPVMADESCCDHHDALRLINLEACDSFNVKLGKSGGIYKACKIISLAEDAGLSMQVGGFLESRLGFTASAHVALTSPNIVYFDFDTPLMFNEDPVTGGITYEAGGVVQVPDVPGLGATVDEDYLRSLKNIKIT